MADPNEDILAQLNTVHDTFIRRCRQLEVITSPARLTNLVTFNRAQEVYRDLHLFGANYSEVIQAWELTLDANEEGDLIYPIHGEPGHRFRVEEQEQVNTRLSNVLQESHDQLIRFLH